MRFSLLHSVQTSSGVHSTSYPTGGGALSTGVKRLGCEVDYSCPSSAEVTRLHGVVLNELSIGIAFQTFLSAVVNWLLPSSRKLGLNSALQLGYFLMAHLIKMILAMPRLFQRSVITKDFRAL
jgi:hypothetical protein